MLFIVKKEQNVNELQSALPMKCLSVPVQILNIVCMCVVPLEVPISRSTEHIRNFVTSNA